jgi:hypothetical protein
MDPPPFQKLEIVLCKFSPFHSRPLQFVFSVCANVFLTFPLLTCCVGFYHAHMQVQEIVLFKTFFLLSDA